MAIMRLIMLVLAGCLLLQGCTGPKLSNDQRAVRVSLERADRLLSEGKTTQARNLVEATVKMHDHNWHVAMSAYHFWGAHGRIRDTIAAGKWLLDHRDQFTDPSKLPATEAGEVALAVASLTFEMESPTAALPYAELAYEMDPDSAAAANDLAWTLTDGDIDPERALPLAKQAVRSAGAAEEAAYMDTLGWTYFKLGQTDQAVRWLQRAARSGPNEPDLRAHLAAAELRARNIPGAYIEAHKALRLKPGHEEARLIAERIRKRYRFNPPGPL